ncbi:MAG: stage V sporulation protein AD [Ruminococcaceae bacterium]|nr:stage V sporulation protein AD [Oscillospiraceae bacterium]
MENFGYIRFKDVYLGGSSATVGRKEAEGPLGDWFDLVDTDEYFGMPTFEQGESEMVRRNLAHLFEKAGLKDEDVGVLLGGDLLNQCVGTSFGVKERCIPFLGLYGACSTIAEGLLVGSALVSGGFVPSAVAMASSHFCTAERQYRFPPEYGSQRPPTAQYTVTGAGAFYLTREKASLRVADGVIGRIVDGGITDANNMGAAMAPAAADTILRYFDHSGRRQEEFDAIVTGDLGMEGLKLTQELLRSGGLDISSRHMDGGVLIFDAERQDMHCGGSGCGCLSTVLGGYFMKRLQAKELKRILAVGTGALLSASTPLQKLSIPGVAHGVCLEVV